MQGKEMQSIANDVIAEEEEDFQEFEDEINRIQEEQKVTIPLGELNKRISKKI